MNYVCYESAAILPGHAFSHPFLQCLPPRAQDPAKQPPPTPIQCNRFHTTPELAVHLGVDLHRLPRHCLDCAQPRCATPSSKQPARKARELWEGKRPPTAIYRHRAGSFAAGGGRNEHELEPSHSTKGPLATEKPALSPHGASSPRQLTFGVLNCTSIRGGDWSSSPPEFSTVLKSADPSGRSYQQTNAAPLCPEQQRGGRSLEVLVSNQALLNQK